MAQLHACLSGSARISIRTRLSLYYGRWGHHRNRKFSSAPILFFSVYCELTYNHTTGKDHRLVMIPPTLPYLTMEFDDLLQRVLINYRLQNVLRPEPSAVEGGTLIFFKEDNLAEEGTNIPKYIWSATFDERTLVVKSMEFMMYTGCKSTDAYGLDSTPGRFFNSWTPSSTSGHHSLVHETPPRKRARGINEIQPAL